MNFVDIVVEVIYYVMELEVFKVIMRGFLGMVWKVVKCVVGIVGFVGLGVVGGVGVGIVILFVIGIVLGIVLGGWSGVLVGVVIFC